MSTNNSFKHQALNLDKTQIRLFRLLPEERSANLAGTIAIYDYEHCPRYRAVSYTWGPAYPTRQISLTGQSFTVRENLWQFLNSAHDYSQDWLWIDQVCIDQSTVDERNHQVSLMAKTYAKAFEVLVWLGIEAHESGIAIGAINSWDDSMRQYELQMQSLFRRPYWDRLWILQEVLMGQNILVLCGNQSFTWKRLETVFIPPQDIRYDSIWIRPVQINDVALSLIEEKASFEGSNRRLSYMLETFSGLQCEDVRDKVYGLLSLVRDSGAISVDYSKTATDVFFNTMQRVVRDESFMGVGSHYSVGQHLRDRMMLVDISDAEIFDFVNKELWKTTVLWHAARNGYEDKVKLLLGQGAELETKDTEYSRTPLSWAAWNGHESTVKLLLGQGAELETKDTNGRTPLSCAAGNGHEAVVTLLLDQGAELETKDTEYSRTPLSWAAWNGHENTVKLLLDQDAELETKDTKGRTPLLWAARNGHEAVVTLLLDQGAELETKNANGRTPLSWAARNGHEAVVMLLLDQGAELETKTIDGRTPLSWAAENGHESTVKLLLGQGAEVETKNANGRTPLLWAARSGHEAVVTLLLGQGAELETKTTNGWTPLSWAAENGHESTVKLLKGEGAKRKTKDMNRTT